MNKPNFFIVGAPKSGTTALDSYLSTHPDIFMARKEMHHFGSDLHFAGHFYRRGREDYLAEMTGGAGHRLAGESSVWYLFSQNAATEIKAFNPDARIIIMLREPSEMIYSLYSAFCFDGNEHLSSFEEALDAEDDRRAGRRISRRAYLSQGLLYRKAAAFAEQVRRYFDVFGRDRVHVILYDDFAADVPGTYRKALDFLGVSSTLVETQFGEVNGNKYVRSRALLALQSEPFVRSAVLAIRPWLPLGAFAALRRVDERVRRFNARKEIRPPMPHKVRLWLKREFAPDIQALGELVGRDLTQWTLVDGSRQNDSQSLPVLKPKSLADNRTTGALRDGVRT